MTRIKRRKMHGAAIVFAVAALAAGRSLASSVQTAAPPTAAISLSLQAMMVADHLEPESGLDPFAPSKQWAPPAPKVQTVAAAPVRPAGEDFRKTHALSALMQSSSGGMAMINGRLLKIGDVVDGYRLKSISAISATLENPSGSVELRMVGASDKTEPDSAK